MPIVRHCLGNPGNTMKADRFAPPSFLHEPPCITPPQQSLSFPGELLVCTALLSAAGAALWFLLVVIRSGMSA